MPSLSQTYRPKRFAEMTSQKAITKTLRRKMATNKRY
jgi:DNA polymerase III gamma/tau subunit